MPEQLDQTSFPSSTWFMEAQDSVSPHATPLSSLLAGCRHGDQGGRTHHCSSTPALKQLLCGDLSQSSQPNSVISAVLAAWLLGTSVSGVPPRFITPLSRFRYICAIRTPLHLLPPQPTRSSTQCSKAPKWAPDKIPGSIYRLWQLSLTWTCIELKSFHFSGWPYHNHILPYFSICLSED